MKLEHVALNLPDPEAAARWYAEHLGLDIVRAATSAPFAHFLSDAGGSVLEFYQNPAGAVPEYRDMSPFTLHLAFSSAAIEADRARLLEAGAAPAGDITATPSGDRLVFLRDPWGVALQLVERATTLV